eukprot:m.11186 g.11186  ORF g.11186 m.11186 type:complete len:460 (+) comp23058_c0_seq3:25-1404(+)
MLSFLLDDTAGHLSKLISEKYVKSLEKVASSPPQVTVIRVNTLRTTVSAAKEQLAVTLEKQSLSSAQRKILSVDELGDVLLIPGSGIRDVRPVCKCVIVGAKCGEAVLRGANVFAPGIIATSSDIGEKDLVSVYADVKSSFIRGQKVADISGRSLVFVGNGITEMARKFIFRDSSPRGVGIRMTEPLYFNPALNGVLPDIIFLQNLPSVVAGHVLDPVPGSCVLDMCAAPGGKTSHIATLMNNEGVVIAIDKSQSKIAKILATAKRFGISCIKAFHADSRCIVNEDARVKETSNLVPPFSRNSFDKILLDAPCSCLGQRPHLETGPSLKELLSFPILQKSLLKAAVQLLVPGGELVYCTCTISPEENESQVSWFLQEFPAMKLVKQVPHLGGEGMPGYGLSEEECSLVQRFDAAWSDVDLGSASFLQDTIGFFITKFRKDHPSLDDTDSARVTYGNFQN